MFFIINYGKSIEQVYFTLMLSSLELFAELAAISLLQEHCMQEPSGLSTLNGLGKD